MRSSSLGIALALFVATAALAQSNRTFVSAGTGSDLNACSRTAPCRSFNSALAVTNAGGEVIALDSGGYGPFTVSKSVGVESPSGVYAGVTVTSGVGVMVNAGASDVVRLAGLTIVGSAGTTGIEFFNGSELTVDNCTMVGGGYGALMIVPLKMTIIHSSISGAINGVSASAPGNTARVMIDDCSFTGNGYGVMASGGALVMLTNSLLEGSLAAGVYAGSSGTDNSNVVIEHCGFSHNLNGVWATDNVAGGFGTVYIAFSVITGSTNGLRQENTGVVLSRCNNTIVANSVDVVGSPGIFTGQ